MTPLLLLLHKALNLCRREGGGADVLVLFRDPHFTEGGLFRYELGTSRMLRAVVRSNGIMPTVVCTDCLLAHTMIAVPTMLRQGTLSLLLHSSIDASTDHLKVRF